MTERTTLLLRHLAGAHYEVDEISTAGRLIYEEIPQDSDWLFEDLKAALDHLGWEVEDDQDAGAHRRLFLKRNRPAPETVREWFQVSTQRRVHRSLTSLAGQAVQQDEAFPGGMIHASDGTRTACGRDARQLIAWPNRPWIAHRHQTCPDCNRLTGPHD